MSPLSLVVQTSIDAFLKKTRLTENDKMLLGYFEKLLVEFSGVCRILPIHSAKETVFGFGILDGQAPSSRLRFRLKFSALGGSSSTYAIIIEDAEGKMVKNLELRDFTISTVEEIAQDLAFAA